MPSTQSSPFFQFHEHLTDISINSSFTWPTFRTLDKYTKWLDVCIDADKSYLELNLVANEMITQKNWPSLTTNLNDMLPTWIKRWKNSCSKTYNAPSKKIKEKLVTASTEKIISEITKFSNMDSIVDKIINQEEAQFQWKLVEKLTNNTVPKFSEDADCTQSSRLFLKYHSSKIDKNQWTKISRWNLTSCNKQGKIQKIAWRNCHISKKKCRRKISQVNWNWNSSSKISPPLKVRLGHFCVEHKKEWSYTQLLKPFFAFHPQIHPNFNLKITDYNHHFKEIIVNFPNAKKC